MPLLVVKMLPQIFAIIIIAFFCATRDVSCDPHFQKQYVSNIPCSSDSDCIKGSICLGNTVETLGICTCKKNFIPMANQTYFDCLPEMTHWEEGCKEDIQCQVAFSNYAECKQKRCVCKQGSHFYGNRCYETVTLGSICKFQQSCILRTGDLAVCLDGYCQCGILKHPISSPEGESCEDNRLLEQECTKDQQCIVSNTRCFGVCRCKPGYTTSSDQTACLEEKENLFDYCIEDSQCETISAYAICEQNRCRCARQFHSYRGSCYHNVKLNESCSALGDCLLFPELNEYVECREGICTCKAPLIDDGEKCVGGGFLVAPSGVLITLFVIFVGFLSVIFN